MAVALFTSRVVLNTLGVEDYGVYNVVGGVVAMFGFINAAMSSATSRYITFALGRGDEGELRKVFCTSVNIHVGIALIILLLAETVGLWYMNYKMVIPPGREAAAMWVYQLSVVSTMMMIVSVPYNSCIIAHERMSAFAYMSILDVVLKLLVVYLLVVSPMDKLVFYSTLILIVQFIDWFIYIRYCVSKFSEAHYHFVWDKSLTREMTSFAGWSFFGSFAVICCNQGVNLLLNLFFGPTVNAARGIAASVQTAINNFSFNFQTAMNPQIIKTYANGEIEGHRKLLFTACKFSALLLTILSLPIILNTKTILQLWLGTVPNHTVSFTQIILLLAIWDSMAYPLATSVQATGKIKKYQIVISFVIFLILPVSYFVLYINKTPEYALLVHFLFAIVAQFVRLYFLRFFIKLDIVAFCCQIFLPIIICLTIVLMVVNYTLTTLETGLLKLLCSSLYSIFLSSVLAYVIVLNKAERNFLKHILLKFITRSNK